MKRIALILHGYSIALRVEGEGVIVEVDGPDRKVSERIAIRLQTVLSSAAGRAMLGAAALGDEQARQALSEALGIPDGKGVLG